MKNLNYILAAFMLLSVSLLSCANHTKVEPQGAITMVSQNLDPDFQNLSVHSGIEVILTKGDKNTVRIEAYANVHPFVEVRKTANTVEIRVRPGVSFKNNPRIKALVSMDELNSVELSGGSRMTMVNDFSVDAISFNLSGGSVLTGDIKASTSVNAVLSGGSRLSLNGSANRYNIECSGGSQAYDYGFVCQTVATNMSGGSRVHVTAVKEISLSASGGSSIKYKGSPIVKGISITGGSTVENVPE